ncbi:MAG TPA: tetratricopeptide repeat protein [Methylomirabilota bacterium]
MTGILIAAAIISIPALAFALWPLVVSRDWRPTFLSVPPDAREQLLEQKQRLLRSLRELAFEHEAGHVSDDDYAELRSRYEAETATVLTELDRLRATAPPPTAPPAVASARRAAWRHPAAVGASAVALVGFGVALGAGIVRYTTADDSTTGAGVREMPPLAGLPPVPSMPPGEATGRSLSPEVLQGMLQAARASLFAERYQEAIAAYQAVLKRDPKNVDAMTHLALIVAIGGHADTALETWEKALAIDPNYGPALLYRGQVLYEVKGDKKAAIASWQKFLAVTPPGEEHERVKQLIARAELDGGAPKK